MIKVSMIVPVYNVEIYLRKCLDSLVNQSFKDMEIIVVNDGSTDSSNEIIQEYAHQYHNIKVIQKTNGGLSSARNLGVKISQGEYIGFVDSDDYIEEKMIEVMYNKAISKDFDLVMCDFNEIHDDSILPYTCHLSEDLFSKDDIKKHMVDYYPSAWNKLYKRWIFDVVQFKEGIWFEDVEMGYRMLPYLNRIGVLHEHFYNYLIRKGSITSTVDLRIYHYIDNWNGIVNYYKQKKLYEKYHDELEYCYVRYLFATFIKTAAKYDKKEYNKAVQKAIEEVKIHFPDYKKNQYLIKKSLKNQYLIHFNTFLASIVYLKLNF